MNPSLCCLANDDIRIGDELLNRRRISHVPLSELVVDGSTLGHLPVDVERVALDHLNVEGFKLVEDRYVVAAFEERLDDVAADESNPACHQASDTRCSAVHHKTRALPLEVNLTAGLISLSALPLFWTAIPHQRDSISDPSDRLGSNPNSA